MLRLFKRRRDELTPYEAEIARRHFNIPGQPVPVERGIFAALRRVDAIMDALPARAQAVMVAAIITFCSTAIGGGVWAGWEFQADRQEDRIEAAYYKATAERGALSDAYRLAYESEMKDRGYSEGEIERARQGFYAGLLGEEIPESEEPPEPRQADTLQLRVQLEEAQGRWRALFDQMGAAD